MKRNTRKNNRYIFRTVLAMLYLTAFFAGCAVSYSLYGQDETGFDIVTYQKITRIADFNAAYTQTSCEVTLTAVGDVMVHKAQLDRAYRKERDSFDFTDTFAYVKDMLSASEYTVANLETTLAGKNQGVGTSYYGYNDYPMFNSPEVLADTLKECGVDLLCTANNHSMDSRLSGVYKTLDYLDTLNLLHTGTARTKEEQDSLCMQTIQDITFGFTAFTYDTNGITVPEDSSFAVNTLKNYDADRIEAVCQRIRALKQAGADAVVVFAHWGIEYQTTPSNYQTKLADTLFAAGADLILGSHPHVVQPMEVRKILNADGTERTGVVIYSLGNFVSSQTNKAGPDKDLGLIMHVTFKKERGKTTLSAVAVTPTYVYWTDQAIGVVPVMHAQAHASDYPFLTDKGWQRIAYAKDKIISVVTEKYGLQYTLQDDWFQIALSGISDSTD